MATFKNSPQTSETELLPPVSSPLSRFSPPFELRKFGVWWEVRRAVRAGVHIEEYLNTKLGELTQYRPQNGLPLPEKVTISPKGEIIRQADQDVNLDFWDGDDGGSPQSVQLRQLRHNIQSHNEILRRELQHEQENLADLENRFSESEERLNEEKIKRQDALGEGAIEASASLSRNAAQRGRPVLTFSWKLFFLYLGIAVAILSEGFMFAVPYLNATGVDSAHLASQIRTNPMGVILGFFFALATMAVLFLFWRWIFSLVQITWDKFGEEPRWRSIGRLSWVLGLFLTLVGLSVGIAGLRHGIAQAASDQMNALAGAASHSSTSDFFFALLTLAVPAGMAYLDHLANQIRQQRRDVKAQQEAFDRLEEERRVVQERESERMRNIEAEHEKLRSLRDASHRKARELAERAAQFERDMRERMQAALEANTRYVEWLVSILNIYRQEFLVQANRRGRRDLIDPPEPTQKADGTHSSGLPVPRNGDYSNTLPVLYIDSNN